MPIDIIELKWRCRYCEEVVLGRYEKCTKCGKPKDDKCEEIDVDDPGPGGGIKDPELLHTFEAGPDWVCKYCDSYERKGTGECANCGAREEDGTSREEETSAPRNVVIDESTNQPVEDAPSIASPSWWNFPRLAVLVVLLSVVGGYFLLRPKIVDVVVGAVAWEHVVVVERYSVFHHDGFQETEPSTAFNIQEQGRRVHHYDHVIDHYDKVSHTRQVPDGQDCTTTESCITTPRSCVNNKNGSKTCSGGDRVCSPKTSCKTRYKSEPYETKEAIYRDDPVYRMYYSWDNWEWAENRRVRASGVTTQTHWPSEEEVIAKDLKQGEQERSHQQGSYSVTFTSSKDHWGYNPSNLNDFERFELGSKHQIKVRAIGTLEVLH